MKKIINLILSFILIIFISTMCSCKSNKNNEFNQKKYVVSLSIENYDKYFNISNTIASSTSIAKMVFEGCVSGGIYDDVIITYSYNKGDYGDIRSTETATLNLGGNGYLPLNGRDFKIDKFEGTVTYWK